MNREHLSMLPNAYYASTHREEARRRFNQFRAENPNMVIDLSGALLVGVSLVDVDLSGADMRRCLFGGRNPHGPQIVENCNLAGADLRGAKLDWAVLRGTNLADIRFDRRTTFTGTNFYGAKNVPRELWNRVMDEYNRSCA